MNQGVQADRRAAVRRVRRRMFIWPVCALTVLAVILFFLLKPASPTEQTAAGPVIGRLVADFTLPTLAGKPASLHQYLGHPLFLQFWAVDCTSCAQERPALLRAIAPFLRRGGLSLGVDAYLETPALVRSYLTTHHEPYTTIFLDPNGGVVFGTFHVVGVPTSLFIDRKGIVRKVAIGEMSESAFRQAFAEILQHS